MKVSAFRTSGDTSFQVARVGARQQDPLDAGPVRAEHLLADAADRQHLPAQRELAGHGRVPTDRQAREEGRERGEHRHAGRGAVLGHGAGRHVDVQVVVLNSSSSIP
jgi:hypothetical protein